jgi:hypothetical protein
MVRTKLRLEILKDLDKEPVRLFRLVPIPVCQG